MTICKNVQPENLIQETNIFFFLLKRTIMKKKKKKDSTWIVKKQGNKGTP